MPFDSLDTPLGKSRGLYWKIGDHETRKIISGIPTYPVKLDGRGVSFKAQEAFGSYCLSCDTIVFCRRSFWMIEDDYGTPPK